MFASVGTNERLPLPTRFPSIAFVSDGHLFLIRTLCLDTRTRVRAIVQADRNVYSRMWVLSLQLIRTSDGAVILEHSDVADTFW